MATVSNPCLVFNLFIKAALSYIVYKIETERGKKKLIMQFWFLNRSVVRAPVHRAGYMCSKSRLRIALFYTVYLFFSIHKI